MNTNYSGCWVCTCRANEKFLLVFILSCGRNSLSIQAQKYIIKDLERQYITRIQDWRVHEFYDAKMTKDFLNTNATKTGSWIWYKFQRKVSFPVRLSMKEIYDD